MSSAGDVELWDRAVQAFDNGCHSEAIELFSSMAAVSSKISFNIGFVYHVLNDVANASKNFKEAVSKDSHLAIGYYMSGICCYKASSFTAAVKDFEATIKSMRGNKMVDYKQLGLKFQLFECEVMTNHAVTLAKMGATEEAKSMLLRASQAKTEKKHEKIEEYSSQLKLGRELELFLPPDSLLFKPPANAVKNVKKKDYLGQAKVLYTADPTDNKSGFSGLKLLAESRGDLLSDIRVANRQKTLRKISKVNERTLPVKLGKVVEQGPPRKPLPQSPSEDPRLRAETWAGKPKKPLPKNPSPQAPARPSNSPVSAEGPRKISWAGNRSENSAFKQNVPNSLRNQSSINEQSTPPLRRPKKPLPASPKIASVETKKDPHLEVEFNFSIKLKLDEETSLEKLKEIVEKQSLPSDLRICYIDGLGRQKKLTAVALEHILQGSIEQTKLICSRK